MWPANRGETKSAEIMRELDPASPYIIIYNLLYIYISLYHLISSYIPEPQSNMAGNSARSSMIFPATENPHRG